MGVKRFEELDCWKSARQLTQNVYRVTGHDAFVRDFGLRDQIRRSAVSVMANIAEGFGALSNPEFIRFLGIAIRSAVEVQSHLYVALDVGYVPQSDFDSIYAEALQCIKRCKALVKYLREVSLCP